MEEANNKWFAMSDRALLQWLGECIQKTRLQMNKTQQQLASTAGVNRSTIMQLEKGGGGTLLTFIQVLRALDLLPLLQVFEVKETISPLLLAKLEKQKRLRARPGKNAPVEKPFNNW